MEHTRTLRHNVWLSSSRTGHFSIWIPTSLDRGLFVCTTTVCSESVSQEISSAEGLEINRNRLSPLATTDFRDMSNDAERRLFLDLPLISPGFANHYALSFAKRCLAVRLRETSE
jgi:hypothetical protein